MIDEIRSEYVVQLHLSDCHPYPGGESLAEGAGGGFDAERDIEFGVTRGYRPPLPELLDVFNRQWEPGEMKSRIEQHRGMSGR